MDELQEEQVLRMRLVQYSSESQPNCAAIFALQARDELRFQVTKHLILSLLYTIPAKLSSHEQLLQGDDSESSALVN